MLHQNCGNIIDLLRLVDLAIEIRIYRSYLDFLLPYIFQKYTESFLLHQHNIFNVGLFRKFLPDNSQIVPSLPGRDG